MPPEAAGIGCEPRGVLFRGTKDMGQEVINSARASDVFICLRCGQCCRHAGEVRLLDGEVEAMAELLGITVHDFTEEYTCLREDRLGLSLRSRIDGACVFLEEAVPAACRVQAAKPRQCTGFPEKWKYKDADAICLSYAHRQSRAE